MAEITPGNGLTQRDIMLQVMSTTERIDGRLRGVELDVAKLTDVRDLVREHERKIADLEDQAQRRQGATAVTWKAATFGLAMLSVVVLIPAFIIGLSGLPV